MNNNARLLDGYPIFRRYMLAESQHISYLFDKAYDDIFKYIFRIIRTEEFIKKYTGQRIYTAYYYDSERFCCDYEINFKSADNKYPIFLYFDPNYKSNSILSTEENTGQHIITIHAYITNILDLRLRISTMKDSLNMFYEPNKADEIFREEMMGHIAHEFVHVRQMFCGEKYDRETNTRTHIDGNPIIRQMDNKEKFTKAINDVPGITDECRDMLYRCFYLFIKTEMDARINASLKHFDSQEKINELLNDYENELKRWRAESNNENLLDPYDKAMLDLCIRKTYRFNDLDDMELCLDYMRKHDYAYHLLKKIDKKENLNFFKYGLEYSMKQYKSRLYKGFYKLLKKYGYQSREKILEAYISIAENIDDVFLNMTCEYEDSAGKLVCR